MVAHSVGRQLEAPIEGEASEREGMVEESHEGGSMDSQRVGLARAAGNGDEMLERIAQDGAEDAVVAQLGA